MLGWLIDAAQKQFKSLSHGNVCCRRYIEMSEINVQTSNTIVYMIGHSMFGFIPFRNRLDIASVCCKSCRSFESASFTAQTTHDSCFCRGIDWSIWELTFTHFAPVSASDTFGSVCVTGNLIFWARNHLWWTMTAISNAVTSNSTSSAQHQSIACSVLIQMSISLRRLVQEF